VLPKWAQVLACPIAWSGPALWTGLSLRNGARPRFCRGRWAVGWLSVVTCCLGPTWAEPVRNGNDFALAWVEASTERRAQLEAAHTNLLHTFRYLRIESIQPAPTGSGLVLSTREPASDLPLSLVIESGASLSLARTVQLGDHVAARGRLIFVRSSRGVEWLLRPALLDFKDRPAPKAGKELLKEVDPKAK